jgi:hypothetical protein
VPAAVGDETAVPAAGVRVLVAVGEGAVGVRPMVGVRLGGAVFVGGSALVGDAVGPVGEGAVAGGVFVAGPVGGAVGPVGSPVAVDVALAVPVGVPVSPGGAPTSGSGQYPQASAEEPFSVRPPSGWPRVATSDTGPLLLGASPALRTQRTIDGGAWAEAIPAATASRQAAAPTAPRPLLAGPRPLPTVPRALPTAP